MGRTFGGSSLKARGGKAGGGRGTWPSKREGYSLEKPYWDGCRVDHLLGKPVPPGGKDDLNQFKREGPGGGGRKGQEVVRRRTRHRLLENQAD